MPAAPARPSLQPAPAHGRLASAKAPSCSSGTIDVHIKTLRRKLGTADLIETVRGVGYRFRERPEGETQD